jgi:hypothetical protein
MAKTLSPYETRRRSDLNQSRLKKLYSRSPSEKSANSPFTPFCLLRWTMLYIGFSPGGLPGTSAFLGSKGLCHDLP